MSIKEDDRIKTFLKIRTVERKNNTYYNLFDNKQMIQITDPSFKTKSEKTITFEIDSIFTDKEENSYIYEEISRDCISECLKGIHYTFVSYGESHSDKKAMMFGEKDSYNNMNSRGIFPKLLFNLVDSISRNHTCNKNYNLNISYLCINKNK